MTARPQDVALLPKHEATLRQYVSHLRSKSPTQSSRPRWSDIAQSIEATLAALASAQAREEELRAEVALLRIGAENERLHQRVLLDQARDRAERLEEALPGIADRVGALMTEWGDSDEREKRDAIVSDLRALPTNAATQTGERT